MKSLPGNYRGRACHRKIPVLGLIPWVREEHVHSMQLYTIQKPRYLCRYITGTLSGISGVHIFTSL